MKIGELAARTGANVETVRYYERIGLLPPPTRTSSNYLDYILGHAERLSFIRQARGLGFDIADIRSLLDLGADADQDCGHVDHLATGHLCAVERKIEQLEQLRQELNRMLSQCRGGRIADCRILEALSDRSRTNQV